MKKRFLALITFFIVSILSLTLGIYSSATADTPVIYKNDTKYSIPNYPAEIIAGEVHVPLSFFLGLDNIQYAYSAEHLSFYLRNKKTGSFFSYSFETDDVLVGTKIENTKFHFANDTVYLPLEYCAGLLDLKLESHRDGRASHVRLVDGTEQLTFKELIELYAKQSENDDPDVITPTDPIAPTEKPVERQLFITVDVSSVGEAERMLDSLSAYKKSATLFFEESVIKENPLLPVRAFVEGHGIGIISNHGEIEEIKRVNLSVYSTLFFNTRLIRTKDEGVVGELEEKGYILCEKGFDYEEHPNTSAKEIARNFYNSTFSNKRTVIRLDTSEKSYNVLKSILSFISDDEYINTQIFDSINK